MQIVFVVGGALYGGSLCGRCLRHLAMRKRSDLYIIHTPRLWWRLAPTHEKFCGGLLVPNHFWIKCQSLASTESRSLICRWHPFLRTYNHHRELKSPGRESQDSESWRYDMKRNESDKTKYDQHSRNSLNQMIKIDANIDAVTDSIIFWMGAIFGWHDKPSKKEWQTYRVRECGG